MMPRHPRYSLLDVPHHVNQRGNHRQPIFFADEDYRLYLTAVHHAAPRYGCAIHASVLMTNHLHVLVTPSRANGMGNLMQSIGRRYVPYINTTYHRTGTLWEGRYRASLVEAEAYFLLCSRYIELNPVRAAMVAHPAARHSDQTRICMDRRSRRSASPWRRRIGPVVIR
jgi:putative transposase